MEEIVKDKQQKIYDNQVTVLIEGFVQLWIRFESMLHKELASTHHLEGPDAGVNHNDSNYSLFYRVSSIIFSREEMTMGELSTALSVPFSKATRMVNWLVDGGYVKRLPDPDDRRIVKVALTEKGEELHRVIGTYVRERVQELLTSSLTVEEKIILFTLINKVVSVLQQVAR
jgi:DNA-binding MarR family transcriptional regulator